MTINRFSNALVNPASAWFQRGNSGGTGGIRKFSYGEMIAVRRNYNRTQKKMIADCKMTHTMAYNNMVLANNDALKTKNRILFGMFGVEKDEASRSTTSNEDTVPSEPEEPRSPQKTWAGNDAKDALKKWSAISASLVSEKDVTTGELSDDSNGANNMIPTKFEEVRNAVYSNLQQSDNLLSLRAKLNAMRELY